MDAHPPARPIFSAPELLTAIACHMAGLGGWELVVATGTVVWDDTVAATHGMPRTHRLAREQALAPYTAESRQRFEALLEACIREGTPFDDEFELVAPDGRSVWYRGIGRPLRDEGGDIVAVHGACQNVTELKLAQRSAEAQRWQAQKMESLGTLAGGIAHDFNNVVAAVLGNAGLALEQAPPGHPLREHLEHIRHAGTHARELVRRILAFSRGTEAVTTSVQPLAPVIEQALDMLRVTLPPGVELRRSLAPGEVLVNIDATGIQQVLLNLCTNAWHALDGRPGRVAVRMRALSLDAGQAQRVAAQLPAGDYAQLSVSDNGTGMNEATHARLFEPFFTTKPRGEGTGLGLPVAHGIVAAHHGAITVESAVGEGSTFHVYLPIVRGAAPASQAPASPAPARDSGHGRRVLLVDDDPVVLLATEHILRNLGYEVLAHGDSQQALDAARGGAAFDVVVTDFSMPRLSGLDLAKELVRLRPGLPVVLSSGYISDEVRRHAERAGVAALLHKENVFEELGAVVARVLGGAGTAR